MNILFVLPGSGRSGGVRVTVDMANRLVNRGHDVTIAFKTHAFLSVVKFKIIAKKWYLRISMMRHDNWLPCFRGPVMSFINPRELHVKDGTIIIAVGGMAVDDVNEIPGTGIKVRYCHENPCLYPDSWKGSMSTMAVSRPLVPLLKQYASVDTIYVVPNGLNPQEYYIENRQRNGIGTIYNLSERKSPGDVITLMNRIHYKWPGMRRYVFSENRRPEGIDKKTFRRYPSIAKARELYNKSKIWLVMSRSEGFGLPILEAMACGAAVISTDHDTVSGIITHNENGLLVPVGDIDAFMNAIEFLLNNEDERLRLVRNGFETVKQFTWDKAVDVMEDVLQGLIGTSPARE